MYIESLYLHNFRNYREETFKFSSGINLIRGDNAQGKTNLLEALYMVAVGRSFHTQHLKELIYKEAPFFFLEARFSKEGIEQKVRLSFDGEVKKLETNHTFYPSFIPLLGQIPIVLLNPQDVLLMTGSPAERRRFLDLHLAQSDPLYVYHITRYHKAVKHRNFLLRQKKEEGLEPWESLMLTASHYIQQKRGRLIEELKDELQRGMSSLSSGKDQIEIRYQPSLTDNYKKHRSKEFQIGATLLGPHRDDLEILINHLSPSGYASQGQLRLAVAALRLSQWHHLRQEHGIPPLFCIDDFGVHLDEARRETLLSHVTSFGQVFLTSAVFLDKRPFQTFKIVAGSISCKEPNGQLEL